MLAAGGHSPWSTIHEKGVIVDLRRYKSVEVDSSAHTVTVGGGLLMKELQFALSSKGEFTGVIPPRDSYTWPLTNICSYRQWQYGWCDSVHDRGWDQLLYAPRRLCL